MSTLTIVPRKDSTVSCSAAIQKSLKKVGTYNNTPQKYTEIFFKTGKYTLDSQLLLNSNTILKCSENVIFELAPNVSSSIFKSQIPVFGQTENTISGLDISGFTFNGNYNKQSKTPNDHGLGYGNVMGFTNISNSKFHDLKGGFNEGDYFRIEGKYNKNLSFYGNSGEMGGHDFIHLHNVDNAEIYNNNVKTRSNNAVRTRSSRNIQIYNNYFYGTSAAYAPLIQLENKESSSSYNINIHNNYLSDALGMGIWGIGEVKNTYGLNIKNNLITNCGIMPSASKISGVGGIIIDGWDKVLIENNTIDGSYGYGIGFTNYVAHSSLRGFNATIYRNIITNTKKSLYPGPQSGTAIYNGLGSKWSITVNDNCLYNNINNYYGCSTIRGGILKDPIYVDPKSDYHLQSLAGHYTPTGYLKDKVTSPCILESGEYGAYNSTQEASKYK